ncbi:MAG: c-type cytochrome domain-containing protein [Planctomycetota bacterium]
MHAIFGGHARWLSAWTFVLFASSSLVAIAEENAEKKESAPPTPVSYYGEIRPIFQQHCQGCHQPAKPGGGYVMTSHADLLKAGKSQEPAITPGNVEKSYLVGQITPMGSDPAAMPKEKDSLNETQIKLIERWIAEGAKDDTPASARDPVDADHPPTYQSPPVITALEYSPDGSLLAVSGYHEVLLHRADGSELAGRLIGLSERVQSLAFSPDGKLLAVTGGAPGRFGEVQIWDVASKKLRLSFPVTYDTVYGASWSPDGSKIAFGCADNTLRAIDSTTGEQVFFQGAHSDWVLDTVFSKEASHLVSVSRDMSMKLSEVPTQRFVDNITSITPKALKGGLMTVDRHPAKDELLIGGADGVPKIYKMFRTQARVIGDDFNFIRAFEPMPGRIFSASFNKDGSRIVAGSSLDGKGEVRVYQTDDAKLVSKFEGQKGGVFAVAFRPDGLQVASGGFDGLVRLNDPNSGSLIKEFSPVPLGAERNVAANSASK